MATMSVSGIVSGMDWESMIDEIITNAAKPAQVKVNKKTNLTNKKSLFEEMKVTMSSLQSSLSALKLPSTYKAKTIDIERLDKNTSYKGVLTATANADASVNVWEVKVNKLATAQINRSKQITDSSLASTLNGVSGKTLYINSGGQKVGVEVKSTDTLESLKSRINTALTELDSPLYITASVVDNKLIMKSDYTGKGTMTAKETVNYNYSSGINRLSNISIPSNAVDNVKITSSGKSYTIHKDFEVANGNEIRWRQYDRGDEVALNDSANIKYTMAAGDVYEKTGTVGGTEASLTEFTPRNNGLLAAQLKIKGTDENGNTKFYYYNKDFTLDSSGNVKWLEAEGVKTNEPSSYTVSYDKNEIKTATANATKSPVGPTNYTVSYSKTTQIASLTYSTGNQTVSSYSFDGTSKTTFTDFLQSYADAEEISSTSGLSQVSSGTVNGFNPTYATGIDNISIDGYEYGKDYVLRRGAVSNSLAISWNETITGARNFVDDYRTNILNDSPVTGSSPNVGDTFTINYTHTDTYNTDGSGKPLVDVLTAALNDSGDYSGLVVKDSSTGREFSYDNGDFSVIGGQIIWNLTNDDNIDVSDVATKYNAVNGTDEIPRVTLTDGNGVLRTYLDLAGDSSFTMTDEDGKTYEYGRDYVIRVNDNGNGYSVTWAISSDTNGDGKQDINDASTVLTTYAQYKELSTYGMQIAPEVDKNYEFNFTGTATTPTSATVSSSATDKSLATILNGVTVNSSDYSNVKITSGSTTYTQGKDYVINSSGEIRWLNQNSTTPDAYKAVYNFSSTASRTVSNIPASAALENVSGMPTLSNMGVKTFADSSWYYVDEAEGKAAFTLTDSAGNVYEYGKDFALRSTSTTGGTLQLVMPQYSNWPSSFSNQAGARTIPVSETLTLTYNNTAERFVDSTETLSAGLGFTPSNYNKLKITDYEGTEYTAETDYTLDTSTGAITWLTSSSTAPEQPVGDYTLIYESLKAENVNASDTEVSITVDSGYGNIGGTALSYEQLTTYAGSDDLSDFFTLTDGTTTYTYGTDYKIVQGSNTDSDTGEHTAEIEWVSGGSQPSGAFTLYLSGNETISTTVKRSADDALSSVQFDDIDDGTVTITQGSKTFYEGVDFELSEADDGSTVVSWIPDDDGGYEWFYPNPGSTYTINHTDDNGNTTTYTGYRTSTDTLDMSELGLTTANGSISVQYGDGDSYKLDVSGDLGTGHDIIQHYYSVDVTKSGTSFDFRWLTPTLTTHSNLPSMNEELTVELSYDANTFDLEDDSNGDLLEALGFVDSSGNYVDYTAADDAELEIDGQKVNVDSNDIGEAYENEIIKGVTLHLKGTGTVSLDISHDAEKAVESIQTFVDNYNDLMTWMNTRMTEKEVDEDTAATIDSDDFRMRWGLLHGNSLLRNTKSQMRSLVSQNFTFSFTERKSSSEVYGQMSYNGLKSSSTLRLRIGSKYVDVTIDPTDTLETIVAKINDDTKNGAMHNIYYDDEGNKLQSPLLKASVVNDKLVINSTSSDEITMSGSAAMNALKMNYTYKGLYQIGIETTSDDYGKSGELVFDTDEFMTALEDNPDEVQSLMVSFANQFNTWTRSMLNSSSSGEVSGTLTREIENIQSQIDTINEYLENYQDRLDRMEESLRTRYANTETSFSKLSQQANSISAILNQLNGTSSGGGYGQTSS